jgi:hypothetical protein
VTADEGFIHLAVADNDLMGGLELQWPVLSCKKATFDSPIHPNPVFQGLCHGDCARKLLSFALTLLAQIRNQGWHPGLPKLGVEEPGHDHG